MADSLVCNNMRREKCNILVCGLLSTGSSALVDLLREYDNMNLIPGEFDDFRAPGLVIDELISPQGNRFRNGIDELTSSRSKINRAYNVLPIFSIFKGKIKTLRGIIKRLKLFVFREKQLNLLKKLSVKLLSNISYDDKIRYVNQWIKDVGNINFKNADFVIYNQPIYSVIDINIWKVVFAPWKLICVYRDPKDQLAEIVRKGTIYSPYGGPYMNPGGVALETIYGRNRKGAINFHIKAIKKRMEWVDIIKNKFDSNQVLLIDFEGFVNNYEVYKSVIEDFIGDTKSHHKNVKMYFDPENAKDGIGIYKEYLNKDEVEQLKELENWYDNMIVCNDILGGI